MFNFTQKDSPAVSAHVQSQLSMFSEFTKQMFNSVQKFNELNIQVSQTLMDEAISNTQQMLSVKDPNEVLSVIAGQAQPNADKIRTYQQQLIGIAANAQVDLIKAAENHIPETSRTAQDLAKEIARNAAEVTEQVTERQRMAMEKVTEPLIARTDSSKGTPQKGATH